MKINFIKENGTKALDNLSKGINSASNIVTALGLAKSLIVSRTMTGQSSEGTKFPDYSTKYKKWKTGQGYSGTPNLSLTGQMMGDIQFKVVTPSYGILFFASNLSQAKAHKHHTGKFPFFHIMDDEYKGMYRAIAMNIKNLVKELK